MKSEQIEVRTRCGDRIVMWKSYSQPAPQERALPGRGRPVLIVPGFAQRMRHMGAIAQYMVANGFTVYRFDSLNHIGLSDGEVIDFCVSRVKDSIERVSQYIRKHHGQERFVVIGASLSARPVIRFACENDWFERIVLLVGVVDIRATIAAAVGRDYSVEPIENLPDTVEVERQAIDPRNLWREIRELGWAGGEQTAAELRDIHVPVINFISGADDWVDPGQVQEVFRIGSSGPRYIINLPAGPHRIAANPVALRDLLGRLTRVVLADAAQLELAAMGSSDEGGTAIPVIEPSFEEMASIVMSERSWERSQLQSTASKDTQPTRRAVVV